MEDKVIALVRKDGRWTYYATVVDMWVLDWEAWAKVFTDAGYPAWTWNTEERGGVAVLDRESADRALAALRGSVVSEDALRAALRAQVPIKSWDQVMDLFPSIFADFDARTLWSKYSELLQVEYYVPRGWTGKFEDFYAEVPIEHRYWLDGERDYLREALGQ